MIDVKIRFFGKSTVPVYKSDHASGADITACLDEPVVIKPGTTSLIPTGIAIELPEGYEAQIRPRSGLALNHGITLLNTPGTIDADYRGEIKVILINLGSEDFTVQNGMRIAQMVVAKTYRAEFLEVRELNSTGRNDGGFGHSGI